MVGKQSQNAEHDVQMRLRMTTHPQMTASKIVFETTVTALGRGALPEAGIALWRT